jgi:hypothetical protein
MSRAEYRACRAFDLTVAIFNNGGLFKEFFRLAEALGVRRSTVLDRIFAIATAERGPLRALYEEFSEAEQRNFFSTRETLEAFLVAPGTIDAYLRGEYGENHVYKARTLALTAQLPLIAAITRQAVAVELDNRQLRDGALDLYLDELLEVTIARKSQLTDLARTAVLTLHFDFAALHGEDYLADPRLHRIPDGRRFRIRHTAAQRADLQKYFLQYGDTPEGLGQFLQRNDSHLNAVLYRGIEEVDPPAAVAASSITPVHPLPS